MTKFEQVGVEFQYDARNKKEANQVFNIPVGFAASAGCTLSVTDAPSLRPMPFLWRLLILR